MFAPSNTGNFRFELPKNFIPESVEKQFMKILEKINTPFVNVNQFVSATIKNVTLPSLSQELVTQPQKYLKVSLPMTRTNFRSAQNPNSLFDNKEVSITFIAAEGWLNYFVLMNTFYYYYNFANENHYAPDFRVIIIDRNGIETMNLIFKKVIFQSLEGLSFSYSAQNENYSEFSATFNYSIMDIDSEGSAKSTLNQGVLYE